MTADSTAAQQPPSKIDRTVPHSARIWNYWLGGKDNFAVDREAGDQYRNAFPGIDEVARTARLFLVRSVRYLAGEAGVRQFLDVGTGLPTADNTHEVAQKVAPDSRIVYVDNDPMVLAHARALLVSSPQGATAYVDADLADPDHVLDLASKTLDFDQPVGLILSGTMGHVADTDEARSVIRALLDRLPSGSYLSLNDGTSVASGKVAQDAQQEYDDTGALPYKLRTPEEIASFFDGLELVEPGVVSCPDWRPEPGVNPGAGMDQYGGVGRKP